ncbi:MULTISPECIES: hypothetical protein [unclassified Chamaesiphon]|uniref:hypothetical protein n=1 Tax=unclassified Chamaesiphon TaxID=2620921 RepID=UPI00286BF40E|nr:MULTISPECIES: hypothetical protein [unclassified Chamaesiphon]
MFDSFIMDDEKPVSIPAALSLGSILLPLRSVLIFDRSNRSKLPILVPITSRRGYANEHERSPARCQV